MEYRSKVGLMTTLIQVGCFSFSFSNYTLITHTELLKLIGFLRRLKSEPDVRPIIRDHFKTFKLIEEAAAMYPSYRY